MPQRDWALDDIVLGAMLGAWLGGRAAFWPSPVSGGMVTATVVLLAYCLHTLLAGDPPARIQFALPSGLSVALLVLEVRAGLLAEAELWQLGAIFSVWLGALALRLLTTGQWRGR